jgi:hypothetical protein
MAYEKRSFVKLEEILSVQFKCVNCKATSTVPIERLANADIEVTLTRICPFCHTPSGLSAGMPALDDLIKFNNLFGRLSSALRGSKLEYSLEIEGDEDQDGSMRNGRSR